MNKNSQNNAETHFSESCQVSIPALSTLESSKLASKEAFFVLMQKPVPEYVPLNKTYRKKFLKRHLPYKLPIIVRAKGDWFVRYYYELPNKPGKFKQFRVRDGINYIHDLVEREKAAQELRGDIQYALEIKNFSPFERRIEKIAKIQDAQEQIKKLHQTFTLGAALMWYIDTKKGKGKSDKTVAGYAYPIKAFNNYYGIDRRIDEVSIDEIEYYLTHRLETDEWTARTYNNNIAILTTFFNYLVAKRKLKVNPIGVGMLETMKSTAEKNRYYDEETLKLIAKPLKKKPALRKFMLWTYYSCARGTELKSLKIKHLDLTIKKITIMAEHGKTGEHVGKRSIPICQELMDIIVEDKLKNYNPEWFLFGLKGLPGERQCDKNFFTDIYWQIKKDLNLDFKFTIYGLKHTRVINLLMAGFDPIKVMHVTGHTDWGSFQKYIRELGAVMDKSMVGNTLVLSI